ncbi:MAG: PEPxxWA-CTERM sorting domain-containing protein [Sphingopyxis sp.]|nr:PEPxxWA-CTERM sorting domain-containing protein [Sphingopyxis sp.]
MSQTYSLASFSLSVGAQAFTPVSAPVVTILDNAPYDELIIQTPLTGVSVPGLDAPFLAFGMYDTSATTVSGPNLPTGLGGLVTNSFFIDHEDRLANAARRVSFRVTSISVENAAVPEPATWATMLLGFGLIGGAMRYRRRKPSVTVAYR